MLIARVVRAAERQMIAARADVAERDRHAVAELALQVGRPLLHARRRAVLIDEADVAVDAGQRAERCCPSAAATPFGNGLVSVTVGVPAVCGTSVFCV